MSCDVTLKGRTEPCKDSIGGLKNIYIANFVSGLYADLLTAGNIDANDQITDLETPLELFKFELRADGNTFEESSESSRDNGTTFFTQSGTITLKKQDAETQRMFKLLSFGRPHILIEDYNNNFKLAGAENGVELLLGSTTGGAMGDFSGFNISFEGKEREPAYFVAPAAVGAGLDFNVSATVINP